MNFLGHIFQIMSFLCASVNTVYIQAQTVNVLAVIRRFSGLILCKQDALLFLMHVGVILRHYFSKIHHKEKIMELKR
jgi:hypothetical protein